MKSGFRKSVRRIVGMLAATLFFAGAAPRPLPASVLPDSGQTACYNDAIPIACPQEGQDYYGQDANYAGIPPTYRDNGDGTITDMVTGLTWQQASDGTARSWSDAATYCDALQLGSQSVWRVPSPKELLTLVDAGRTNPAMNPVFTVSSGNYWTNATDPVSPDRGAFVVLGTGVASHELKYYTYNVLCVSGDPTTSQFMDNGDGTVTDVDTGLMWRKEASATTMDWKHALAWCADDATAGYADWRVPGKRELDSLVEGAPLGVFMGTDWAWSGTTNVADPRIASGVDLGLRRSTNQLKATSYRVRCVRAGLPSAVAATLSGTPPSPTAMRTATVTVGGEGVVAYKYRLDAGSWSEEAPVATPIALTGLSTGTHTLSVIGKDASGNWQSVLAPVTATWIVAAGGVESLPLLLFETE